MFGSRFRVGEDPASFLPVFFRSACDTCSGHGTRTCPLIWLCRTRHSVPSTVLHSIPSPFFSPLRSCCACVCVRGFRTFLDRGPCPSHGTDLSCSPKAKANFSELSRERGGTGGLRIQLRSPQPRINASSPHGTRQNQTCVFRFPCEEGGEKETGHFLSLGMKKKDSSNQAALIRHPLISSGHHCS